MKDSHSHTSFSGLRKDRIMAEFKQSVEIKNLMGVKSCKFTLDQFMVLVGEQSTGKSTICKAVYYLRKYPEILTRHLQNLALDGYPRFEFIIDGNPEAAARYTQYDVEMEVHSEYKDLFQKIFGISRDKQGIELKYQFTKDYFLRVYTENENRSFSTELSSALHKGIVECIQEVWRIYVFEMRDASSLQRNKRQGQINAKIEKMVSDIFNIRQNTVYIPAGRSLLTLTAQQGGLKVDSLDYITGEFVNLIAATRKGFSNGHPKPKEEEKASYKQDLKDLHNKAKELLKGEYHIVDGQERFSPQLSYGKQDLGLNYTSSGQQEMLWVLNALYLWAVEREKLFVIIEEPEAHLFPAAQRKIMEIVTRFINLTGSFVLITTHSPYILTAVNNLIYADHIREKVKDTKQLDKLVPEIERVNSKRFAAWLVGGETYFESIVNPEYCEIDAARIDDISNEINRLYGELYALLPEEDVQ
jgi:predicted ATPase